MSHLNIAKEVIKEQSKALQTLSKHIPEDLTNLVNYILKFKGRVVLTGMGKSGYIAKKIAASLASTGTPAFFIHPGEASHGDLGMITSQDLVIMLSNSGETKELFDTVNYCKRYNIKIAAMTMKKGSTLAINSNFLLNLPVQKESSSISAPTTSALMTLSFGDALVTALHEAKGFSKEDFKLFHPGGKIGASLLKVKDIMRSGNEIPIVYLEDSFVNVIVTMTEKCLGCTIVLDKNDKVSGIVTDGDLRRHITDDLNNMHAKDVMTQSPKTITSNMLARETLYIMNSKSITALPVIDNKKLVGIVHIHDTLKVGIG